MSKWKCIGNSSCKLIDKIKALFRRKTYYWLNKYKAIRKLRID